MTGPAGRLGLRGDPGSRIAARQAAERLQREHPRAEVRAVRLRNGDGLEAIVGGERVAGPIDEVDAWLGEQTPAGEERPGSSPAGQDGEGDAG